MIELLIIMAIMAMLSTLLLPALNQARSKAKSISCVNKLKQHRLNVALYASDFKDRLSPAVIIN